MPRDKRAISVEQLRHARERFVQAWGQMGPSWGISRTMAEAHALLYIHSAPMNTDEVMEQLQISRGNASMTLRALVEWGLISRVHKRGDRKEYFEADQDTWSIARTIIRERLRREILPLLATLHELRDETGDHAAAIGEGKAAAAAEEVAEYHKRLDNLTNLVQTIDKLGERFVGSDGAGGKGLQIAATLLSKAV